MASYVYGVAARANHATRRFGRFISVAGKAYSQGYCVFLPWTLPPRDKLGAVHEYATSLNKPLVVEARTCFLLGGRVRLLYRLVRGFG